MGELLSVLTITDMFLCFSWASKVSSKTVSQQQTVNWKAIRHHWLMSSEKKCCGPAAEQHCSKIKWLSTSTSFTLRTRKIVWQNTRTLSHHPTPHPRHAISQRWATSPFLEHPSSLFDTFLVTLHIHLCLLRLYFFPKWGNWFLHSPSPHDNLSFHRQSSTKRKGFGRRASSSDWFPFVFGTRMTQMSRRSFGWSCHSLPNKHIPLQWETGSLSQSSVLKFDTRWHRSAAIRNSSARYAWSSGFLRVSRKERARKPSRKLKLRREPLHQWAYFSDLTLLSRSPATIPIKLNLGTECGRK